MRFFNKLSNKSLFSARGIMLVAALGAATAGCGTNKAGLVKPIYPATVQERHPIVVAEGARTLDVFVSSSRKLDNRQRTDIRDFAYEYRRAARSPVKIALPAGDAGAKRALGTVRQALSSSGVPARNIKVATYTDTVGAGAAPIRLSFMQLQAGITHKCGQWPTDLAGGDSLSSWQNREYWNFGCAYQANLAAQIAEPLDYVRARREDRVDTVKRMNSVESIRKGQDPTTNYSKGLEATSE